MTSPSPYTPPSSKAATRLDPEETAVQPADQASHSGVIHLPTDSETTFRHAGWQHRRDRAYTAMLQAHFSSSRTDRFAACGMAAWVYRSTTDPEHYLVASSTCHDRFCVPCSRARAANVAASLQAWITTRTVRFITLTLRHSDAPLSTQLNTLYSGFRRLRKTPDWQRYVAGGVAFVELKRAKDAAHWHPHLHLLTEGNYFPKSLLATLWHHATRTSYIVDIQRPATTRDVLRYVTKYVAKPLSATVYASLPLLVVALAALKARRLMLTFGTWRKLKLSTKRTLTGFEPVLPLHVILEQAASGDPEASRILALLLRRTPCQINRSHDPPSPHRQFPSSSRSGSETGRSAQPAASR